MLLCALGCALFCFAVELGIGCCVRLSLLLLLLFVQTTNGLMASSMIPLDGNECIERLVMAHRNSIKGVNFSLLAVPLDTIPAC